MSDMRVFPKVRNIVTRKRPDGSSEKPPFKKVLKAIRNDNVNAFQAWFSNRVMNFGHIQAYRNKETGDTLLHVAAAYRALKVLKWFLKEIVPWKYAQKKNKKGKTALDLALKEKKKLIATVTHPGDFHDSLVYASGNRERSKMNADYRDDMKIIDSVIQLLEEVRSKAAKLNELIGIAMNHGSVMGVQKLHEHFPEAFTKEHAIKAYQNGHHEIASFIASILQQ